MKTIYRVEHIDTGLGIFRSGSKIQNMMAYYINNLVFDLHNKNMPSIALDFEDKLGTDVWNYICGYKTIEDIIDTYYPNGAIKSFTDKGFKIYIIHVSHYFESPYQIIFRKEHIKYKEDITENILELIKTTNQQHEKLSHNA